jgi:hypothetical protein
MPTIEVIKFCNDNSSKQLKSNNSSWKYVGVKWKQPDNIVLNLKLIELIIYDYEAVKPTGNRRPYYRSIL